tara:strand:+ start:807 stop:1124 length:318 start_codon:yes stop_codon:yes gene_type:complete
MAYAKGMQKYTVQESQNIGLGQSGYVYVSNTGSAGAGTYVAVTSLGTTAAGAGASTITFTTPTEGNLSDFYPTMTTIEVPAGVTIYGRWSNITVAANDAAVCYKG